MIEIQRQKTVSKHLIKSAGVLTFLWLACTCVFAASESVPVPLNQVDVVSVFPHDTAAFTQGLTWHDGFLYEGTGRNGESSLRKVELESGELLNRHNLNRRYFGEGVAVVDDKIYQLTWQSHLGFVYDLENFTQQKTFFVAGEGWGITHDGEKLIISDGSPTLRFLDADTQQEISRIDVTLDGDPVQYLNELEFINGEIWANIWYQDVIVRIDPQTGKVNSMLDLSGLYAGRRSRDEVLNGIAWDEEGQRVFVTGKLWPNLYEIQVRE
ncbi:MAG: glutaminyl-peptide cyclotransferase [Gammaproteobacteria bacterium]|nr:glutaminyl-peptide cyclotransferase [Gammaproteobacteria bacterium]